MTRGEDGAREQVLSIAAVLAAVRARLFELSGRLPEEEAGPESEETRPGLKSILQCVLEDRLDPALRDLLLTIDDEAAPAEERGEPDYRKVIARVNEALPRLLREQEMADGELEDLATELEGLDGEERARALAEERFHRLDLVDKLLEDAGRLLPEAPDQAEELARLAREVALRLTDPAEASEGRARAVCRLANARRLLGDHAGAALALSEATLCPSEGETQGEVCRALALLRWEEGRMEEAAALLTRAAELWAEEEVTHEEGACQVLRALLLVEEGRAREVVHLLRDELPVLVDMRLTLYGGLSLALGLAEQGLVEKARTVRDESSALVLRSPAAAYLYALYLEGEIEAGLGEIEAAAELHEDLRREALRLRLPVEAAVATLALSSLDRERGKSSEAGRDRAAELAATFEGMGALAGVLAALQEFPKQVGSGESPHELATALGATFRRLLRLQSVRSAPLPFV